MARQHVCVRVKELFEGWGCTSRSSATICVGGLALATVMHGTGETQSVANS